MHTLQKGTSWYPFFDFAWKNVCGYKPFKCSLCDKFKVKSVLQTNISYIAKNLFPIALLWLCITECMQETPYNFLIKVSLLCIILPSKYKSGYYVLLLFHPKVSFQCIIKPSKTKESLHYISILYIKRVLVLSQQFMQKELLVKICKDCFGGMEFLHYINSTKRVLAIFS